MANVRAVQAINASVSAMPCMYAVAVRGCSRRIASTVALMAIATNVPQALTNAKMERPRIAYTTAYSTRCTPSSVHWVATMACIADAH
jgi:hypothetical protein